MRDTFKEYRDKHRAARLSRIESAVKALNSASYKSISSFAKAVARIVTEFEEKNCVANQDGRDCRPMSHITLLKNKEYRSVLEGACSFPSTDKRGELIDFKGYQELKIKCAGLMAKISTLEQCIRNIDLGAPMLASIEGGSTPDQVESMEDQRFLLDFIDDFQLEMKEAIEVVHPEQIDEYHPEAGLYGPMTMIRDYSALERLQEIRKKLESSKKH